MVLTVTLGYWSKGDTGTNGIDRITGTTGARNWNKW
jgi:hypothetical protein